MRITKKTVEACGDVQSSLACGVDKCASVSSAIELLESAMQELACISDRDESINSSIADICVVILDLEKSKGSSEVTIGESNPECN